MRGWFDGYPMTMYACCTHYYCDITCSIVMHVCIQDMCVCKAWKLISQHFQAQEVIFTVFPKLISQYFQAQEVIFISQHVHRWAVEHLLSMQTSRVWSLLGPGNTYYSFYLHPSRFFGHRQGDFLLTISDTDARISAKWAFLRYRINNGGE